MRWSTIRRLPGAHKLKSILAQANTHMVLGICVGSALHQHSHTVTVPVSRGNDQRCFRILRVVAWWRHEIIKTLVAQNLHGPTENAQIAQHMIPQKSMYTARHFK